MTTTDTNLQIVNSMTQAKLNELKNSEGKIPSLANQLIMTNEDDVNVDCLRSEVIYDMTSSDSNLNWGYPAGIQGSVEIVKDLTKYQYIDIVPQVYKLTATNTGGWSGVYRLDLTSQRVSGDWCVATYTTSYADAAGAGGINNDVWKIVFYYQLASKTFKWLVQFNNTSYNSNADCVIAKIYGILKTPTMIYTGKELNAGDGISINNGTIGKQVIYEGNFNGNYPIILENANLGEGVYDIIISAKQYAALVGIGIIVNNDSTSGHYWSSGNETGPNATTRLYQSENSLRIGNVSQLDYATIHTKLILKNNKVVSFSDCVFIYQDYPYYTNVMSRYGQDISSINTIQLSGGNIEGSIKIVKEYSL